MYLPRIHHFVLIRNLILLFLERLIRLTIKEKGVMRNGVVTLLARVWDHAEHKYVHGFRMLTLGWSDGNTFLPVFFSLLSSENERNRLCGIDPWLDKRTTGSKEEWKVSKSLHVREIFRGSARYLAEMRLCCPGNHPQLENSE